MSANSPAGPVTLLLLAAFASGSARAEGYSLDPELLRTSGSADALPGMDSPVVAGAGGMRVGTLLQLEQDPIVLYMSEDDRAAVVSSRGDVQLGVAYDWNDWLSTRMVLPVAFQGGGDLAEFDAAGFGMRNLSLGGRASIASVEHLDVAVRADLGLPTGTRDLYMGEARPRVDLGLLLRAGVGPVEALVDAGFSGTTNVETEYDLAVGSEAVANAGLRFNVVEDRFALGTVAYTRTGAETSMDPQGIRAEGLAVAQAWLGEGLQLDLGVGRGLTAGVGTTAARFLLGVTWIKPAHVPELLPVDPEPEKDLTLNGRRIEAELPDEPADDEDIVWKDGELARVEVHKQTITIRDDIQFAVGTSQILPDSLPVLDQVAELMASYWQIDHLLIEGHASEEGEYAPNFQLSIERARSIYVALVEAGVHPQRISFRGFGEVSPKDTGQSEQNLAANRRVEFHIIEQLEPLEVPPEYPDTVRLPWTGEVVKVRQARERLLGQEVEVLVPLNTDDDKEAMHLLRGLLEEGDDDEEQELEQPEAAAPDASKLREYAEEITDFDDLLDDDEPPTESTDAPAKTVEQPVEDSP